MKEITKLQAGVKDKQRVNLYLDNKFFCSLDMETVVKYNLKAGIIISEEKLSEIQLESEKQTAYNKALKLVSVRYKTQKEVQDYLYNKGYLPAVVAYAIKKLNEYHFIDDERYVDSFIASHKNTMGKLKLKQLLFAKGVSENLINEKLEDDFEQTEQIKILAEKYMRTKENNYANKQKLARYLMGKGFEFDDIKKVINEVDD